MQQQQNTTVTEIGMIVLAGLLIVGGVLLVFFGKISFTDLSPFLVAVLGLFGINVAWKAPSPAQLSAPAPAQPVVIHNYPAPPSAPAPAEAPVVDNPVTPVDKQWTIPLAAVNTPPAGQG